jgi:hypothetical protein
LIFQWKSTKPPIRKGITRVKSACHRLTIPPLRLLLCYGLAFPPPSQRTGQGIYRLLS